MNAYEQRKIEEFREIRETLKRALLIHNMTSTRAHLDESIESLADHCRGAIYGLETIQIDLRNLDQGLLTPEELAQQTHAKNR